MTTSIVKELEKNKTNREQRESNVLVEDTKLLLAGNVIAEKEALRAIGLSDHLDLVIAQQEQTILDKHFAEKYEGQVFRLKDLVDLGMKYRLFLKPAMLYKGTVPADLGAIVARMKEKYNLNLNSSVNSDSGNFMIMAPPSSFKDYMNPLQKISKCFTDAKREREARRQMKLAELQALRARDPMLLYRAGDNHFILLKKWGSDLTIGRRLSGMVSRNGFFLWSMLIIATYYLVQLPFRAWLWADLWVSPVLCTAYNHTDNTHAFGHVENSGAYGWSHVCVFIVSLVITAVIAFILLAFTVEDKTWSFSGWSTKAFYRRMFKRESFEL